MIRNRYATLWIWMFIFPLALDYKAPDAQPDHTAQALLVTLVVGAGLALALIAPRFRHRSALRSFVTLAILLTLPGSVVAQFVQGNEPGNYLLLPFLLFAMGYQVACHPWSEQRVVQIEKALFWANLVCVLFTLVFAMATGGALETMDYRILSVALLGLQGVLLHEFVVAKRFSAFTLLVFLATVVVELLSATRSLLAGTVLLFGVAAWMSARPARHVVQAAIRASMAGAVIGAIALTSARLFPTVAMHSAQRLLVEEETVSHFWNYLLFAGGILFSVGLPVAVLAALFRCAFAYRRWRVLAPHALLLPALGRMILLLAALPAASIGGNPLGPRFSALVFGVASGLAIALYAQLTRRPDTARAPSCPPWRHAGIEPSFGIAPAYPAGADSVTANTHRSERQAAAVADTQAYHGTFYSRPVYSFAAAKPGDEPSRADKKSIGAEKSAAC